MQGVGYGEKLSLDRKSQTVYGFLVLGDNGVARHLIERLVAQCCSRIGIDRTFYQPNLTVAVADE